ncbi:hypothetical protein KCU61_g14, partial [Aureobasidium melanogenum]
MTLLPPKLLMASTGLARNERNPIFACIPLRTNVSPADVEDAVCYSISMCLRFHDHRLFVCTSSSEP